MLQVQKLQQLKEQYDRYIKADTVGHIRPAFLVPLETVKPVPLAPSVNKTKCSWPACDGSGHIQPGKNDTMWNDFLQFLQRKRNNHL